MRLVKLLFSAFCVLTVVSFTVANSPVYAQSKGSEKKQKKFVSKLLSEVLAKAGSENITFEQLENAYRKNMVRDGVEFVEVPRDTIYDFLNLYVNYRLKVQAAAKQGLGKDSSVLSDIKENRAALAPAYLLEKVLTTPHVEKLLNYRKRELKIAVILLGVEQVANPDTTKAYKKAMTILEQLKKGADFAQMARDSSDDEQSRSLGGEIPFITGGMILREVEDEAYTLKVGQVSSRPIRTRYGYFIIKLLRDEPRVAVHGSHILIGTTIERDSTKAYQIADSVLQLVRGGADFGALARANSDDKTSAQHNGSLTSWYTRSLGFESGPGKLVASFEDALMALRDGETSSIVHTQYGFHIIKRDSSKTYSEDDERETLKKLYKRQYFDRDKEAFVDSLKKAYGYEWNEQTLSQMLASIDSSKSTLDTAWAAEIPASLRGRALYGTRRSPLTVAGLIDSVKARPDMRGIPLNREGITRAVARMIEPVVMEQRTQNMEKQYEDFAVLMNEYRDALLAFRIEDKEVWSKLKFDSTRARAYYESTKSEYKTEPKYDLTEIFVTSDTLAQQLYDDVSKNNTAAFFENVAATNTQRQGMREKNGKVGVVGASESRLAAMIAIKNPKANDILAPMKMDNGYVVVRVNAVEAPRQKTFEEALPEFAVKFQDTVQRQLTQQWIERLRAQYPVVLKKDTINSIWSHGG